MYQCIFACTTYVIVTVLKVTSSQRTMQCVFHNKKISSKMKHVMRAYCEWEAMKSGCVVNYEYNQHYLLTGK